MKYLTFTFMILCFLTSVVMAQEIDKMPMITVTGSAEVMVNPDEVVFSIDVTKLDKDLQVAKKNADEAITNILNVTKKFSIPAQDVKTDSISVNMKYELVRDPKKRVYDEDGDEIGTKIFKGYEVSKTLIIRYKQINRFEEIYSDFLKTGLTAVNYIRFETSKLRENKDKARDMAMKAAKEKATDMAAAIGQTVGKAIKITEGNLTNQNYYSQNYSVNGRAMPNATSGSVSVSDNLANFEPGAISVKAEVTVSFLLN